MFTAMDLTLAHDRREEMARQAGAGRPENGLGDGVEPRGRRWPSLFALMLRAPSGAGPARAGGA